ncbi:MAG: ABC transporter permease [Lachnospiraceae bacterium]|nr:ABC transporter permease [Lachnospiraceae bacterium]
MKTKKGILDSNLFYTILAIVIGFAIGAIFLLIAGISPAVAYGKLIDSVFSKPKYMVWTLVYAAPVIFTGLSVAFSFRTGVFNIGAEGQYIVGSVAACVIGILVPLPPVIHPLVCILAAAGAGCLWSLIVGVLKTKRGIHEVLSFIMFNWIAYYLQNYIVNIPIIHKKGGGEATENIKDTARIIFPDGIMKALDCTGAHWGFIFAVIAAIIIFIIIEKTTLGYELKAVGFNKNAAEFAGINVNRSMLTALGISGALAGLGGAVQTLGMAGRLPQLAAQEGYGFEGITVALIAGSNPLGCIFSGIFYGAMKYGGSKLTMVKAPSEVVNIIMGCVIIFIAISQVFKAIFTSIGKKRKEA